MKKDTISIVVHASGKWGEGIRFDKPILTSFLTGRLRAHFVARTLKGGRRLESNRNLEILT